MAAATFARDNHADFGREIMPPFKRHHQEAFSQWLSGLHHLALQTANESLDHCLFSA